MPIVLVVGGGIPNANNAVGAARREIAQRRPRDTPDDAGVTSKRGDKGKGGHDKSAEVAKFTCGDDCFGVRSLGGKNNSVFEIRAKSN